MIGDQLVAGEAQFFTDCPQVMVDADLGSWQESRDRDDLGENSANPSMDQPSWQVNEVTD